MIKNNGISIIFFISLLVLPGCKKQAQEKNHTAILFTPTAHLETSLPKTEHHFIVFIHGTLLPLPSLMCFGSSIRTLWTKGCPRNKTWYQIYLDELKHNSIFKYQPNGPDGLCQIGANSSLLAQISADYFINLYRNHYPNTQLSCYTFGWSGRLNHKKRVQAAHELYQQLVTEAKKIEASPVKIILFGHSHGGNVVLNLARAEETYHQKLVIDKTILLGTPIQSETRALLANPMFTSIYNCYSHGDNIQKIDFVSTKDDYSQRRFTIAPSESYARKLTQIELQLGNKKPGHGELWLQWGKKNPVYRKNLPIFPLPAFVFLPEIIQQLESFSPMRRNVMVNIDQKDANYTIAVYENDLDAKISCKKLSDITLPKKFFTPYITAILQNENVVTPHTA